MCIIAVKPQGKSPLPTATITDCWNNNPDGAGFVIRSPEQGVVLIRKGFMTLNELLAALKESAIQDRDTVIYHFRIATSGGISPANCHPFPISTNVNDLKALTLTCKTAFVHNGTLGNGSKDLSDTQIYVLNTLSRYGNIKGNLAKIQKDTVGSRTAFLNADGELWLTGRWIEENGYYYSNETFTYQWWNGSADASLHLEQCDCCLSQRPLMELGETLLCEECNAEYGSCNLCECWQLIDDMDSFIDEKGNEILLCYSCSNEPIYNYSWKTDHRESNIQSVIDQLLQD